VFLQLVLITTNMDSLVKEYQFAYLELKNLEEMYFIIILKILLEYAYHHLIMEQELQLMTYLLMV